MPLKELERLQSVNRFLKLDFSKEKELQDIVTLAAAICGTSSALITFLDDEKQYIKAKHDFYLDETYRRDAFCDLVVGNKDMMIVEDTLLDPRFQKNALVLGEPNIRFYAGAPLITDDGHALGSLCVIDRQPKQLNELQQNTLDALSRQVIQLLEFEVSLSILKNQYLQAKQSEIELRSFFESSLDHHLLLNNNFKILAYNKAWDMHVQSTYNLFMKRGELMTPYIHPRNLSGFHADYMSALNGVPVFDERCLQVKGKDTWRRVRFEPALDGKGEIIGVSVNCADITQQVEQKRIVDQQEWRLKEIAFLQSHELRRPVASILGLVNLLDLENPEILCQQVEEIKLLQLSALELDKKIRLIVGHATSKY